MSPAEWDETPWWYSALLIEGLQAEGVLSNESQPDTGQGTQPPSAASPAAPREGVADLSGAAPLPGGFRTRRVG